MTGLADLVTPTIVVALSLVVIAVAFWAVSPFSHTVYVWASRRFGEVSGAVISGTLTVLTAVSGLWILGLPWRVAVWMRLRR